MKSLMNFLTLLSSLVLVASAANAGQIEYSTDTKRLPDVCGAAPDASTQIPVSQYALNSRKEFVTRYTVRTPVYDCEDTQGDGRGGDWKGFYDRAGDKAAMLAAAIKGVGAKTAPYLVAPFQAGKPRSWRAFSDLITSNAQEMERKYGINPSWASNVLKQYKAENIVNLGYVSSTECRQTGTREETYEDRQFIEDVSVVVETQISGGKLLPTECESYSVSFNGREVSGNVSSNYNQYAVTTHGNVSKAIVTFQGLRKAVGAPYFVDAKASTAIANAGSVVMNLRHSTLHEMMQVPEFANSCKVNATATLIAKKGKGWFAKKSAPLKTVTFALNGESNDTSYTVDGVAMKDGEHPVASVTLAVAPGCPFFNVSSTRAVTIEE